MAALLRRRQVVLTSERFAKVHVDSSKTKICRRLETIKTRYSFIQQRCILLFAPSVSPPSMVSAKVPSQFWAPPVTPFASAQAICTCLLALTCESHYSRLDDGQVHRNQGEPAEDESCVLFLVEYRWEA